MMAAQATAGGNSSSDRVKKATAVTAVADSRIQAVIVTAPKDLMLEIADVVKSLDVPSERDQDVYVFKMKNGDPQEALTVLQGMFSNGNTSRNGNSQQQNSALQQRQLNGVTTMGNTTTTSSGIGGSTGGYGGGGGRGGGGNAF
jgi:type II secretory pathway component GspD/PulD (secretin)